MSMGTSWASNSWSEPAWATGTWADVVIAVAGAVYRSIRHRFLQATRVP